MADEEPEKWRPTYHLPKPAPMSSPWDGGNPHYPAGGDPMFQEAMEIVDVIYGPAHQVEGVCPGVLSVGGKGHAEICDACGGLHGRDGPCR